MDVYLIFLGDLKNELGLLLHPLIHFWNIFDGSQEIFFKFASGKNNNDFWNNKKIDFFFETWEFFFLSPPQTLKKRQKHGFFLTNFTTRFIAEKFSAIKRVVKFVKKIHVFLGVGGGDKKKNSHILKLILWISKLATLLFENITYLYLDFAQIHKCLIFE